MFCRLQFGLEKISHKVWPIVDFMGQKRCFQEKFEFWLICADISGGKISFPNPRNICSGWERHKTRSRLMAQLYGISASITATNSKNPDPIHPNSWKQSCKRLWIICASFNISSRGSFRQHEIRRSERFCPLSAGKETSSQVHRTRTADRIREPPTRDSQAFIRRNPPTCHFGRFQQAKRNPGTCNYPIVCTGWLFRIL